MGAGRPGRRGGSNRSLRGDGGGDDRAARSASRSIPPDFRSARWWWTSSMDRSFRGGRRLRARAAAMPGTGSGCSSTRRDAPLPSGAACFRRSSRWRARWGGPAEAASCSAPICTRARYRSRHARHRSDRDLLSAALSGMRCSGGTRTPPVSAMLARDSARRRHGVRALPVPGTRGRCLHPAPGVSCRGRMGLR